MKNQVESLEKLYGNSYLEKTTATFHKKFGVSKTIFPSNGLYLLDEPRKVALIPGANLGDLLISSDRLGSVTLFSFEKMSLIWKYSFFKKRRGFGIHTVSIDSKGHLLVFLNILCHYQSEEKCKDYSFANHYSAIATFNPRDEGQIIWQWPSAPGRFLSDRFSNVQELPNGHYFLSEKNHGGHVMEVSREGEVFFDYYNQKRDPRDRELYMPYYKAEKIDSLPEFANLEETKTGFLKNIWQKIKSLLN